MKNLIYALGIISVVAFTSCKKEQSSQDLPEEGLVTLTFTAEKAGIDTRTAAVEGENGVSYVWTDDDINNIKLFSVTTQDGKEHLTVIQNPTISIVSNTKLTISAQVAPNTTYTFRAVLSGDWTNDGKQPRVETEQHPSATNFDPSADILVSDDKEVVVGDADGNGNATTGDMLLRFRRQIVVNKMDLKSLTAGETIDKVVITSDKHLTGYYSTDTKNFTGDGEVITVKYNNTVSVPASGQFPVYFTTIPGKGHRLTVEVTTDQNIYTKTFAEGSTIDFESGYFTRFGVTLPSGTANVSLSLPVEDSMSWAMTGGSDSNVELTVAELTPTQEDLKVYDSSTRAYKGADGLKLGNADYRGSITTNKIDLSSAFYVAIDAKTFGSDASQVKIQVDGTDVYTSGNLSSNYKTYYWNCNAATAASSVSVSISGKRGYIRDLYIGAGTYVAPPKIIVSSNNPLNVANTASSQTITYSIDNPSTGVTLTASEDADWITNLNYATNGQVTFDVAAQEAGAPSRSADITLSYTGAKSVKVTINQAAKASSNDQYVLVTSLSSVTAGTYVIVNNGYYLPNAVSTNAGPAKNNNTKVTVSGNTLSDVTDAMTWDFSGSLSAMTIKSTIEGNYYLLVSGNGNSNLRVNTSSTIPTWTISDYSGTTGAFSLKDNTHNRYCATYSTGADWRSYNTYNASNYGDNGRIYLYKKATSTGEETVISINFAETNQRPNGFPSVTPGATALATYTIAGYDFSFFASTGYYWINAEGNNQKYLLIGETNSYILFPAIDGQRLTGIKFHTSSSCSTSVQVGIYSADGNTVIKSPVALSTQNADYQWSLTGTATNTRYQFRITNNKNAQLTSLELTYE